MIKAATALLGAVAIGFGLGVYSVPDPVIILTSNSIIRNAKLYNVGAIALNATNVNIDSNRFYWDNRLFTQATGIRAIDSENATITHNIMDAPEPLWDTVKYKFVARPENFACIIDGVGYKDCNDIPADTQK